MHKVKHREEATQVTPDGLAAAAGGLISRVSEQQAVNMGYNLTDLFWFVFDQLAETQKAIPSQPVNKRVEEGRQLWLSEKKRLRTVSTKAYNALKYAYNTGVLTKPLDELTDAELLEVKGFGIRSLEEIRWNDG